VGAEIPILIQKSLKKDFTYLLKKIRIMDSEDAFIVYSEGMS